MEKINLSIAYGIGSDNRYKLSYIPDSIQLSIYKYSIYKELEKSILNELNANEIQVKVIHLPMDTLKTDPSLINEMIINLRDVTGCKKYIIHPDEHIKSFINYFISNTPDNIILCIENYSWEKKKVFRSPLQIIEYIQSLRNTQHKIRLCFDTSHSEELWFDYKLMSYLLNYIDVIHLSNREGNNNHIPFNSGRGELKLVKFVNELIAKYKWSGDIVLEYMPEHHHKLISNVEYIKKLLNSRSK